MSRSEKNERWTNDLDRSEKLKNGREKTAMKSIFINII